MKRFLLCCMGLWLVAIAVPTTASVDPFYRNRMESGTRAFELSDWDEAAQQLRIACFGYLEEPPALVEGLVRLALAEAARGNDEAFRRVFSRIADVEEKFSAYNQAKLPDELRRSFESEVVQRVPTQRLLSVAAFRELAERAELSRLAGLPRAQRRAALEERLAAEPDRPELLIELARLELEARRPILALEALDRLPEAVAARPRAVCLRQQAASEAGSCERMDLEQPFCRGVLDSVIEFRLECLVEAGRWQEAAALIAGLPAESRGRRRIVRLERRVDRQSQQAAIGEMPPGGGETDGEERPATGTPPAAAAPPVATTAPPSQPRERAAPPRQVNPAPEPLDPARLASLRRRLSVATTPAQLEALMNEAGQLARDHPSSRELQLLAAEIAYLSSDWPAAVAYFRRAGELRPDEVNLAFYLSVALYETGEAAAAAELLRPIAARLERTRFVGSYIDRILAVGGPSAPPGS